MSIKRVVTSAITIGATVGVGIIVQAGSAAAELVSDRNLKEAVTSVNWDRR